MQANIVATGPTPVTLLGQKSYISIRQAACAAVSCPGQHLVLALATYVSVPGA